MDRDHEIWAAVGAVIRGTRTARGLTLKALASLADLDWSQLSKVERGTSRVADATLERIAHELGFTLPALYAAAFARVAPADKKVRPRGRRAVAPRTAARVVRSATGNLPGEPTHSR